MTNETITTADAPIPMDMEALEKAFDEALFVQSDADIGGQPVEPNAEEAGTTEEVTDSVTIH